MEVRDPLRDMQDEYLENIRRRMGVAAWSKPYKFDDPLEEMDRMNTEAQLQNYLRVQARKHGVSFDKIESQSRRGMMDVLLIYKGIVVFVEVKSPAGTGRLSKLQEKAIQDMREHGAWVEVVASVNEVDEVILELTQLGDA